MKTIDSIAMQFNFIKLAHDVMIVDKGSFLGTDSEIVHFQQALRDEGYPIQFYINGPYDYVKNKCLESFCSAFPLDKPRQ
jgi:hypothetical protein